MSITTQDKAEALVGLANDYQIMRDAARRYQADDDPDGGATLYAAYYSGKAATLAAILGVIVEQGPEHAADRAREWATPTPRPGETQERASGRRAAAIIALGALSAMNA